MRNPTSAARLLGLALLLLGGLLLLAAPAPVRAQGDPTAIPTLSAGVGSYGEVYGNILQVDQNYEVEGGAALAWEWRGTWTWEYCGPSGCSNSHAYSTDADASVAFYVNGAGLTLYRRIGPGVAGYNVCIELPVHHCIAVDNSTITTLTQFDQPVHLDFDSLGYTGPYYVYIRRNPASDPGAILELDRIRVLTPETWLQMPTPWPTVVATPFMRPDAVRYTTELSGNIINGYRWLNTGNVMSGLSFFAMLVIVFSFIMRGIKRLGKR